MTLFEKIIYNVKAHYLDLIVVGVIMVSAIIMFIGILKPVLFNKIKNKGVRKGLLALSDIVFAFIATAVYFLIESINWEYYWVASAITSLATIVAYWVYENTSLRTLIEKIGTIALKKFVRVGLALFTADEKSEVEQTLNTVIDEVKSATKAELKSTSNALKKGDKELENL